MEELLGFIDPKFLALQNNREENLLYILAQRDTDSAELHPTACKYLILKFPGDQMAARSSYHGCTPLHLAVVKNRAVVPGPVAFTEEVELSLQNDEDGNTALHSYAFAIFQDFFYPSSVFRILLPEDEKTL